MKVAKKTCQFRKGQVTIDRCQQCQTEFKKQQVKIIYRDCAECLACGNIFVVNDLKYLKSVLAT